MGQCLEAEQEGGTTSKAVQEDKAISEVGQKDRIFEAEPGDIDTFYLELAYLEMLTSRL